MMKKNVSFALIVIIAFSIAGCIYSGPETSSPETQSTPIQTHIIGQSVDDGNSRMTLNNVRYTQVIDEKKNESHVARSETNKQFLIINVTIENISPNKNMSYNGYQFIMLDSKGIIYEEDASASKQLAKKFNGNDMVPGDKREGELSFQIPVDAKGLRLRFEYSQESTSGLRLEFFKLDR